MAGPRWGEAEIDITADGRLLNQSVARIAEAAGRLAGTRVVRGFNRGLTGMSNRFSDQLTRLNERMNTTERIVHRLDRSFLKLWKTLPHGFRQFTFYTTLFANLGESIAVLGASAGAGLLTLGGTATFAAVGLTAAIVAFTGLDGEISDLPESIRPAVQSLRNLGGVFSDLRRELQIRTLTGLETAFDSIGQTVRELTPDFAALGDITNGLVRDLATEIAPGTKQFQNLQKIIRSSGPVFDRLMRIIGRFGGALLTAFASPALLRSVNEFLGWLDDLSMGFEEFVNSNGLDIWLGRASQVFGAIGRLLEATGRALNNLVDAEAVGRLVGFLDNITAFMPSVERLLDVLGELDIFGLIAEALATFGEALAPLHDPLMDFAGAINDIVQSGIETLGPIFEDIASALAPLVQSVADFLAEDPQAMADALLAIAAGALALKGAQGLAGLSTVIATNIGGLAGALKDNDWKTIGTKMGKGGAAAFIPALVTGLFSGEGGAGITIASGAIGGLTVGGLPGLIVGALIASIVSMFTDPGSWANGAEQIATFFQEGLQGILAPESWELGWEQIKTANDVATAEIGAQFEQSWADWGGKFQNGRDQINQGVSQWWTDLMAAFENGGVQLGQIWNGIWTFLTTVASTVWITITSGVSSWWSGLMAAFSNGAAQIAAGWNGFWAGLTGIVSGVWATITSIVRGGVNGVVDAINWMISRVNAAISALEGLSGGLINLPSIPNLPRMASGGLTMGPSLAGEAGTELIVPLQRPLSMIDPVARPVAALLRGNDSFINGGGGTNITVEAGAVAVATVVPDPRLVGISVVDALVARLP